MAPNLPGVIVLDREAGHIRSLIKRPHDNHAALPIQECGR
jgi:hypothetical protein